MPPTPPWQPLLRHTLARAPVCSMTSCRSIDLLAVAPPSSSQDKMPPYSCHCEHSEAISRRLCSSRWGLLRRSAPRNDADRGGYSPSLRRKRGLGVPPVALFDAPPATR